MQRKNRRAERPEAAIDVPKRWVPGVAVGVDPPCEEAGARGRGGAGRGRREARPLSSGDDWSGCGQETLCPTLSQCSVV